jgi:RNA polymerase sigma-70 factor (ECF subfamily)
MDGRSESTSLSLLDGVRAHDPQAWQRLVRIYGPLVYGWARRAGVQPDDAADVVQEVFAAVSTLIPRFRRDRPGDSFRGWLWTICANRVRNHFHALLSRPAAEGGSTANLRMQELPGSAPDEASEEGMLEVSRLRCRAVLEFRDLFEPHVWEAFWGVTVEERAPAEVATALGVSVWAVYKAKSRVLQRLRRQLEGLVELQTCD